MNVRLYMFSMPISGGAGTEYRPVLELSMNALWNSGASTWTADDTAFPAHRWRFRGGERTAYASAPLQAAVLGAGLAMDFKKDTSSAWADGASPNYGWENSFAQADLSINATYVGGTNIDFWKVLSSGDVLFSCQFILTGTPMPANTTFATLPTGLRPLGNSTQLLHIAYEDGAGNISASIVKLFGGHFSLPFATTGSEQVWVNLTYAPAQ